MSVERARSPRMWCRLAAVLMVSACGRTELWPPDVEAVTTDAGPSEARDAPAGDAPSDGQADVSMADAGVDRSSSACGTCAPGQTCQPTSNPFSNPSVWLGGARGAFPVPAARVGIADMNHDGRNDLVFTTGSGPDSFGVCLGHGDGTFDAPLFSAASSQGAVQLAIADFDGDGRLDVAGTSALGVNVDYGNGDGTLRPGDPFVESDGTSDVAVGDINGDGRPDLAASNLAANDVEVYPGVSGGQFGRTSEFSVGSHPVGIALADFDGDGRSDVATVNTLSGNVTVRLETPLNIFNTTMDFPAGAGADAIGAGDFDGDGHPDLAVALQQPAPGNLVLLFGHGDGTFDAPHAFDAMTEPTQLAVGDINGDGVDDVVCSSSVPRSSAIGILFGSRARSFDGVHSFCTGDMPEGIALADIDGDGRLDVATADTGAGLYPNGVGVVFGGGGHGALFAPWMWPVGAVPNAIAQGDLNGDGRPDLVTANSNASSVSVLLADGHGGLLPERRYNLSNSALSLVVADIDNDGKLDIVAAGYQLISVLRGNGDGTFLPEQLTTIAAVLVSLDVGDVNGDGRADAVVGGATRGAMWVLLGHGDGTFDAPTKIGRPDYSALSVEITRFFPGGAADLVVAGSNGSLNGMAVLRGNGDGTFQAPLTVDLGGDGRGAGTRWYTALADLDRDGHTDLAIAGPGGQLVVLPGTGGGAFSTARPIDFGDGNAASVFATDLDSDGLVDLIVATLPGEPTPPGPHDIAFLRGRGDGTFDPPQRAAIGSSPAALAMIDLDQDGRVDVAAAMSGSDSVNVIFNRETFQCR